MPIVSTSTLVTSRPSLSVSSRPIAQLMSPFMDWSSCSRHRVPSLCTARTAIVMSPTALVRANSTVMRRRRRSTRPVG
ncbi:hypothetical protein SMD44_08904 [Streptomyces alboflavus]|uniref:Uncharacterized protein n=1 Tax=Streptomyces alboflavus TaxID=67267 RepID=A0A1Z1WSN5_9ACTN|nr:hypothetical protein SMD44_08904 [Streptomyces alboflavus]